MKRTLATLLILMPCGSAFLAGNESPAPRNVAHGGGEATFEGLGDLPGGSFSSTAYDVSPDGHVVVGMGTPESGVEAFRWQNGMIEGLGSLPGAPFQSSTAYGVSLDGSVIVGQSNSKEGFLAFRYEDGTMVGLGMLPGGTSSGAYGVSDDGLVPVGFGNGPSGLEAVRWIDGTPEGLGHLPDGNNSTSRAVSADGSVVVGQSQTQGNEEMAFRWEDGEMVGLGYLAEFGFTSWAYDVTADGAIVVGLTQSDYDGEGEGGDEAFLWQDGEMVGLGELAGGFVSSWAHGVSDDGAVVVGQSSSEENIGGEAFIWTAKDGMRSLQQVLESDHGLDLTGWTLREAIAVSADGTVIVGNGVNPDGNTEAWRASLPPPAGTVELTFDPASLAFGDVEVGTTSPPQITTLTNAGDADATGVTFSGLPEGGFAADTIACGGVLPTGESCTVSVTFTPAAPGPAAATLHVASDEGATAELGLSGNGIGGSGPIAEITPASFSFAVPPGGGDSGTLTIGNLGDADLDWSLDEAESDFVPEGAPYRHGLAEMPAFRAPVGYDRAAGRVALVRGAPATPIVLPAPQSQAIGELAEGFDDITQLPGAGWALINNSEPVGPSSWFQGNETIFPAHEGEPDAYIAANFESTDDVGTISNWLITPEVTIANGTTVTFWTRKAELFGEFADRMEVRMSIAGESTDVGDTAESVGDFTEVLLTINPDLIPGEYPQEWTQFVLTVRERSREPVTGRFAFRYWVTDAGPDGTNADYIGIDTVSVTQPGEPPTGGCDNPVDIPWLSADPTSGTTAPGASEPVDVAVDTADLEVGEYTAQLCMTTNDPNAPLVEIPVLLTVTGIARVSVASDGSEGNDNSFAPALSADGRHVVFDSLASNLVPGDGNGRRDVFVHDRASATTARVSVAADGSEANDDSAFASVSADGRYVVFLSAATNLVPDDTNGVSDVFVHDRETATTDRVSVASDGAEGNDESFSSPFPAISADGRYVAFESAASNLVAGDTNGARDVFVHDRMTGTTERVSIASDGGEGNETSWVAVISADGRYVAFQSFATNLVAGDANETADIFVHDRDTGITIRVSVASDGTEANGRSLVPAISADGGQVAFDSLASNLAPDDTNGALDIFVHDLDTGTTERLSVASDGTAGNADSPFPAISADGRRVAFASLASNLVMDDTNATLDIFVHDRETGATERASVAADGSEANGLSLFPAISADGHHVAFESVAANLVPDDKNGVRDVFVRSGLIADVLCGRGRRNDAEEGCDAGTEAATN